MKGIILIVHAIRDLIIRYLPRMKKRGGFVFLVHPRDISDVYRKYPFAKYFSDKTIEFFLKHFWPVVLSEIEGLKDKNGNMVRGWVISIPLTAKQMMNDRELAKRKIFQATKLSEKMGATMMGLGALTASLTRGGLDLINKTKVNITTGRAYTVKIVTDTFFSISKKLDIDFKNIIVGIVGAAGGVGSACAKILAKNGIKEFIFVDVERKKDAMESLLNEISHSNKDREILFKISHNVNNICNADIIIAATSSPDVVIKPEDLKPGAVIINDAQPSDISPDVFKERGDVLVVEGGIINTPGINYHFNFGLADKEDSFCCLGEVMILASNRHEKHYALGFLDLDLVDDIKTISKELNFGLAKFQNPVEGKLSDIKIDKIKNIISQK